ncbi:MAG: glycosyltransferase family 2 protein [Candidatus Omnitrophica bacterium]|nr:glycosyltransferase family 2 protein [Candidatus Omnitrophota bacterium]
MDKSTPLVSVIIPVYNRAELLDRTLKSILSQTYKNLEIIVIDDGSSEDIKTIINTFGDGRTVYLKHNANKGISAARNTGLAAAKGDFIEFLDSDDEYLPEKTERQIEILKKTGADVVYCARWICKNGFRKYELRKRWFCLLQQIMMKKECVEKIGRFDELYFNTTDDKDYVYRLSKVCRFEGTREPLVLNYDTPNSASKKLINLYNGNKLFIEKHTDTLPRKEKSILFYKLGRYSMKVGKIDEGYKTFLRAYTIYPFNADALRKLIRIFPLFLFHRLKRKEGKKD